MIACSRDWEMILLLWGMFDRIPSPPHSYVSPKTGLFVCSQHYGMYRTKSASLPPSWLVLLPRASTIYFLATLYS